MNINDAKKINIENKHNVRQKETSNKVQSTDNKKIGKGRAIELINKKLSLNIDGNNSAYSSINASVNQWSFNINNSYFSNDFYVILEDQEEKILYCFYLKKGTIGNPTIIFNQRNDERRKNASIVIIPKNDRNFTNNWQENGFQFINYKILEMRY